jgi:hypothetical protein
MKEICNLEHVPEINNFLINFKDEFLLQKILPYLTYWRNIVVLAGLHMYTEA